MDAEGRSVKGADKFNRFLTELVARVRSLVLSSDPHERLAGVLAADELASTKVFSQSAARLGELVKLAMEAFQATTEVHTMQAAAATLGRIVKAGGALMADVVEEQVGWGGGGGWGAACRFGGDLQQEAGWLGLGPERGLCGVEVEKGGGGRQAKPGGKHAGWKWVRCCCSPHTTLCCCRPLPEHACRPLCLACE